MDEKMQILKMVEDGIISSEEGLRLLDAIGNDEKNNDEKKELNDKVKFLKVKVIEGNNKNKINIKIPVSLINVGIKIGKKFSPELQESMGGIDFDDIIQMVKEGNEGRLVDIETEDGETVQIFVE